MYLDKDPWNRIAEPPFELVSGAKLLGAAFVGLFLPFCGTLPKEVR